MADRKLDKKLKKLNKEVDALSRKSCGHTGSTIYGLYSLAIILGILLVFSAVYLGASMTGFVTFSESVISTEDTSITIESSRVVRLSPDIDNIDALMLSGTVSGSGRAAVFLETGQGRELAYFFEGDAGAGESFSDLCFDTCHLRDPPENLVLSVELTGTTLYLDSITYMYSKIIDFELQPVETVIDYSQEKAKVIDLVLTNKENADYSVVLLLDGPLAEFFTWQGSMIRMTADQTQKTIPLTVRLPSDLPQGTYTHKITARYIPPDTHQFTGTAPVAEAFIEVVNE